MAKQSLPFMLERIRRCQSCGTEIDRPPLAYEENPYCSNCLLEEIRRGKEAGVSWRRTGGFIEITRDGETLH